MVNPVDLLDKIIKAPLWFFFATAIGCGLVTCNFSFLKEKGVDSSINLFGAPIALYGVFAAALFISSATARAFPIMKEIYAKKADIRLWKKRFRVLSDEARALLDVVDQNALESFCYSPQSPVVLSLQDNEIAILEHRGDDWARLRLSYPYQRAIKIHRKVLRNEMLYPEDIIPRVVQVVEVADRNSKRLSSFGY